MAYPKSNFPNLPPATSPPPLPYPTSYSAAAAIVKPPARRSLPRVIQTLKALFRANSVVPHRTTTPPPRPYTTSYTEAMMIAVKFEAHRQESLAVYLRRRRTWCSLFRNAATLTHTHPLFRPISPILRGVAYRLRGGISNYD